MYNTIQMIIFVNTIRNIFQWGAQSSLLNEVPPCYYQNNLIFSSFLQKCLAHDGAPFFTISLRRAHFKIAYQFFQSDLYRFFLVTGYTANAIIKELYLFKLQIKCFGLKNRPISTCNLKKCSR